MRPLKIIVFLLLLIGIYFSIRYLYEIHTQSFHIDLRNRIIGARLLGNTDQVYTFNDENTETLFDPLVVDTMQFNRVTVSPQLLLYLKPLSSFSYSKISVVWFFNSILAFFLIYYFILFEPDRPARYFIYSALLIFLFLQTEWMIQHISVGQIYIFYAALLALYIYFYKSEQWFYLTILIAVSLLIRPNFIFLCLPLLIHSKWKYLLRLSIISLVLFLVSISYYQISLWPQYFTAMQYWSTGISSAPVDFSSTLFVIEGVDFNIQCFDLNPENNEFHNLSIKSIFQRYFNITLPTLFLLILFGVYCLIVVLLIAKFKADLMLVVLLLFISMDYFLPSIRGTYTSVLLVPLVLYGYQLWPDGIKNNIHVSVSIIALLLASGFMKFYSWDAGVAELLILVWSHILLVLTLKNNNNTYFLFNGV